MVTIYALCDDREPDSIKRIRYVGQTSHPLAVRLHRHFRTARFGNQEHRAIWLRKMLRDRAVVTIEAIECVEASYADQAEIAHFARLRALGCDLTNRTDGGRGHRGEVSAETRLKMRESAKRHIVTPEWRAAMSAGLKASPKHQAHLARLHKRIRGMTRTAEQRERISRGLRGEGNGQNVLTRETAQIIRERYAAGAVQAHLAREFGCSGATIHAVVHGLRWVPE